MFLNENKQINLSVLLKGGLGNQMFQIASVYSISKTQGANFYATYMNYINPHSNIDYSKSIFRKIKWNNEQYHSFNEPPNSFARKIEIPIFYQNTQMGGFYQNEKYFSNFRNEILELFEMESERYSYLNNKYKCLNNGFFIHFRRGDYVNNPHYDILGDYYEKALEKIQYMSCCYYILSNDIEYCKNNILLQKFLKNKEYYYIENEDEINSLYIMSLCKMGGIAANSTFSWWGGYLNQNPEKIVIYPKKWYHNNDIIDIWWNGSIIL